MQPMLLYILKGRQAEDTYENTQWRTFQLMQPMWIYFRTLRQFEDTFATHSGKTNETNEFGRPKSAQTSSPTSAVKKYEKLKIVKAF